MALQASSATDQIEGIKTTLASLLEADRKDEALDLFVSVLSQLATDHDKLQHQLRLMIKARFGRKTERIDPAQLRLFLEELQQGLAEAKDASQPIVAQVRRMPIKPKAKREASPASIPRERLQRDPSDAGRTTGCGAAK